MRKVILVFCFYFLFLSSVDSSFAVSKSKEKEPVSQSATEPPIEIIKDGLNEFNNLSKHEKKSRLKEMKRVIKEFKAQKKAEGDINTNTLLLVLLALFIPPLAVYLHEGELNNRFWISVLLTILGLVLFQFGGVLFLGTLPGIIYALYIILSN